MYRILIIAFLIIPVINQAEEIYAQEPDIQLKRILLNYDSLLFDISRDYETASYCVLENKYNNILFDCFTADSACEFSFFLEGNDERWSLWFYRPVKEYTNLKPGEYSLYVRSKGCAVNPENLLLCNFRIKPPYYLTTFAFIIYLTVFVLFFILVLRMLLFRQKQKQARLESVIQERTEELTTEKEKTETLLANILPKDTADEIMSKGKATKQKYNFVTVLFSDIQGFTRIAEEVNPEILIDELDNFFFHFDSVVEKYNIEKIKTIGDAYMCAGGIPLRNRTNPIEVVLAALEMQEYMIRLKKEQIEKGIKFWDIRVGIHTGTVIAGVVGQKKLSYDIWGDTVNTASRMESSGEAGKINISGVTYEYVKDFFICEYRGRMPVKYKGDLDMYFVKGIRPELRKKGKAEPNSTFINKLLFLKIQDLEDHYFEWYENNVPETFVFHNPKFIKNICTQAELLATAEQLPEARILGLRLASIFIKSGLLKDYNNPGEFSLEKLKEMAPEFGFEKVFIEEASDIIKAVYSNSAETKEIKILLDAIYDYYGHIDYPEVVQLKFREENEINGPLDKPGWYKKEIENVKEYNYFTNTAQLLRSYGGEEQAEKLKSHIEHSL